MITSKKVDLLHGSVRKNVNIKIVFQIRETLERNILMYFRSVFLLAIVSAVCSIIRE